MGRPRAFDRDQALDQAMDVFWRHGYEGASLAELTRAMGINPPSLYAAFGNKEGLFKAVLDRYGDLREDFMAGVQGAPTAREAAERFLLGTAQVVARPGKPLGCLVLQSGLACSVGGETVADDLAGRRGETECLLKTRFERARDEGDLPAGAQPAALARYLTAVTQGMAVQAAGGASPADLRQVAEMAMKAWPGD